MIDDDYEYYDDDDDDVCPECGGEGCPACCMSEYAPGSAQCDFCPCRDECAGIYERR